MPDLKRVQEIAIDVVFFFNLHVVKKFTIFLNNVMYLDDALAAQLDHIFGIFEIVTYIYIFPNSLVMYNFYHCDFDFFKFAPIMESFFIEFVSDITWDSMTFEIIIQVISFVKFCCRISPFPVLCCNNLFMNPSCSDFNLDSKSTSCNSPVFNTLNHYIISYFFRFAVPYEIYNNFFRLLNYLERVVHLPDIIVAK